MDMITKCKHVMIKPAEETWKGVLPLSELDQVSVVTPFSLVYFYNRPTNEEWLDDNNNNVSNNKIINTLKESLSRVLVPFYPLAGRLRWVGGGRLRLECNAAGAEFIEAESQKEISDFGEFYSCGPMFQDLLPRIKYYESDMHDLPLVAVQVTRFQCGGLSLGISTSHVLNDGTGAFHFTKEWTRLALGLPLEVAPFLDRRVLGGQDVDSGNAVYVENSENNANYFSELRLTQKENWAKPIPPTFIILTKDQIQVLKKIANNNGEDGENSNMVGCRPYSRFEVVAAHVWRSICKARKLKSDAVTTFTTIANARGRVDKSLLPLSYYGNAILTVHITSTVEELISRPLSYGCGKVREAVGKATTEYLLDEIEFLKKEKSLSEYQFIDDRGILEGPSSYTDGKVLVVSLLNLPGRGLDFGWGKDIYFGPPIIQTFDGEVILSPHKDDGSVVVGAGILPREIFHTCMNDFSI